MQIDKVSEFYARWFAKKQAHEYRAAEVASEELANHLLGVQGSNKRDFWQSCAVKFLRGTILHLSSQAQLQGKDRMTLREVIGFLEAESIAKTWKELIASQANDESIRRIAAEAGELMLEKPGASRRSHIRDGPFECIRRSACRVVGVVDDKQIANVKKVNFAGLLAPASCARILR